MEGIHSDWLSMMYPRLKLARNLLKDDGVIFISIGEDEVSNLEKLCNEIYGEDNKIGFITRVQKKGSDLGTYFSPTSDYILVYAKNQTKLDGFKIGIDESKFKKIEEEGERKGELYEDSKSLYQSSLTDLRKGQKYFIDCPDGSKVMPPCKVFDEIQREGEKRWRWSKERYLKDSHLLVFKKTKSSPLLNENGNPSKWNVYTKRYLNDAKDKGNVPSNLITDFLNSKATSTLKTLDMNFSFSKPKELISHLIEIIGFFDEIVLDLFSGSGTTAHSVLEVNEKINKTNKFIMVQLPESIDGSSIVDKSKYKNICEIGKERIRRAGDKIKEDNQDRDLSNLDIGFKVFKLDSSNIKEWDSDFDNLEENLLESIDNIKSDRTSEDLLYEILLKYGLDLTLPIKAKTINNKKVFVIGYGALVVCLDDDITTEIVEEIAKLKEEFIEEYGIETTRIVFKDSSFKDAIVKTNAIQILKQFGIDEVVSI